MDQAVASGLMARSLDAQQKAELVEFLEELYRAGGYSTQAQWAREANYHPTGLSDALNRSKTDGLDGYSLLRLIRAAADRVGAMPVDLALPTGRASAEHAMESLIARRLEELAEASGEQLILLREIRALQPPALEEQQTPERGHP